MASEPIEQTKADREVDFYSDNILLTHADEDELFVDQAAELALTVKNVVYALVAHSTGGYGQVYNELHRRFTVSSANKLKRDRCDEARTLLSERYEATSEGSRGMNRCLRRR